MPQVVITEVRPNEVSLTDDSWTEEVADLNDAWEYVKQDLRKTASIEFAAEVGYRWAKGLRVAELTDGTFELRIPNDAHTYVEYAYRP